jgi:hypothetical protein
LRCVEQAGRQAECPAAHRACDHLLHAREFSRGRRPIRFADGRLADRTEADQRRIIQADGLHCGAAEQGGHVRIAAAIIADHDRRDALHQKAGQQAHLRVVGGELRAGMSMRIDEARRDDQPACVDHPLGRQAQLGSNGGDAIGGDRHIADEGRRPIRDRRPTADQQIGRRRRRSQARKGDRGKQRKPPLVHPQKPSAGG